MEKIKFRLQQVKELRERELAMQNAEDLKNKLPGGKFKRQMLRPKTDGTKTENCSYTEHNSNLLRSKRKFEIEEKETKGLSKKSKREENEELVEKLLEEEKSKSKFILSKHLQFLV